MLSQKFGIIQTFFDDIGLNRLMELSSEERLFAYYMSEAAREGYNVTLFQYAPTLFQPVFESMTKYLTRNDGRTDDFFLQLKEYWIYLFANYGVHYIRETLNNKKTPSDLGLNLITPQSLEHVIGRKLTAEETSYLFDKDWYPSRTVLGDIEKSGGNFYPRHFTNEMYQGLTEDQKTCLIGFPCPPHPNSLNVGILSKDEHFRTYGAHQKGVCEYYFSRSLCWIKKALKVVRQSEHFDENTVKSLETLITCLETGDETHFKQHSKYWLKMNNRVEYNYGLIEYYDDPMSTIGTFQADVTVKSMDVDNLTKLLPSFEERFPFPEEWKRKDMSTLPNASVAHKVMGTGGLGPILSTIAYCLPNYNDIRSELGSKQIMYSLPAPSNVERYKQFYLTDEYQKFYDQYSPDLELEDKIYSLLTTLHETIGHASGGSSKTEEERKEGIGKYWNGLEEMRAEILAVYTAITFYDEIAESGILDEWPSKVPKDEMRKLFILDRVNSGWKRWGGMQVGEKNVTQAHAIADTGIMYYLIDHSEGTIKLCEKEITVDGEITSVLYGEINDLEKAVKLVEELATLVQRMSSEADPELVQSFMDTYATSTRDERYSGIVKNMKNVYAKGIDCKLQIFPEWLEVKNVYDKVIDAIPFKPQDPFDACLKLYSDRDRDL